MINLDQFIVILTLSTINIYIIYWFFFKTKSFVILFHESIIITILIILIIWLFNDYLNYLNYFIIIIIILAYILYILIQKMKKERKK